MPCFKQHPWIASPRASGDAPHLPPTADRRRAATFRLLPAAGFLLLVSGCGAKEEIQQYKTVKQENLERLPNRRRCSRP
jgi:hypothetical protein